jgi:hypothetical protein
MSEFSPDADCSSDDFQAQSVWWRPEEYCFGAKACWRNRFAVLCGVLAWVREESGLPVRFANPSFIRKAVRPVYRVRWPGAVVYPRYGKKGGLPDLSR